MVNALREERSKRKQKNGTQRPSPPLLPSQVVARSHQRYMIFAFFSLTPDRQRTVRELEVGRTLIKVEAEDGAMVYAVRHNPMDYKTGRSYGQRPLLPLTASFTAEVDEFINKWRPALKPKSAFLFCKRSGEPLTQASVYWMCIRTAWRLTGKRTNPHLLRVRVCARVRVRACVRGAGLWRKLEEEARGGGLGMRLEQKV